MTFIVFHITGRVIDYGNASFKIYSYKFHTGSISAYPDANITISDDMIKDDEDFQMVIIDAALPFGVEVGHPATIFTNDNDDSKCSKMHTVYLLDIYTFITCISHDVCVFLCVTFIIRL